ncbi:MAG: sugar transferase [Chitinophagaceae bacterium]|nr:sugar transferase [Chitinophagaceae bacterium]
MVRTLRKKYLLTKRGLDLICSVLVIAGVLSWLLPMLALLIKLDSRGPVFFLQKRIGRGGRIFICYKLRTMVVNGEADEHPVLENDARITMVGRFLRISHLDEMPQFFNVLMGTMSLVGPRPYMLMDNQRFSDIVPGHSFRLLIKPGITGLSQVKGFHERVIDLQTIFSRYQWDAFYVRNASLRLDLRILRRTTHIFFTKKIGLWR